MESNTYTRISNISYDGVNLILHPVTFTYKDGLLIDAKQEPAEIVPNKD